VKKVFQCRRRRRRRRISSVVDKVTYSFS